MKIVLSGNSDIVIYNFRLELVERLIADGHDVYIVAPYGPRIERLKKLGASFYDIKIDRHGINPLTDFNLILTYIRIFKEISPDYVFSYTIKPNLYGGIACEKLGIRYISNITGLGTAVENPGLVQKIALLLYKVAFKKVQKVFVQNSENREFLIDHNIAQNKLELLPGSGVNLERYSVLEYPDDTTIEFVFISRIMKEKGIDQYIEAASFIRGKYPNTRFHICGFCEQEYEDKLEELTKKGIVNYHGMVMDIRLILKDVHCTIHPSYYPEGLSNTLLESAASGRPIITTDRSGCREVVDDGINGYKIPQKNTEELIKAIEKFILLSNNQRKEMGIAGRRKVEKEFNRQIVVDKYLEELYS